MDTYVAAVIKIVGFGDSTTFEIIKECGHSHCCYDSAQKCLKKTRKGSSDLRYPWKRINGEDIFHKSKEITEEYKKSWYKGVVVNKTIWDWWY